MPSSNRTDQLEKAEAMSVLFQQATVAGSTPANFVPLKTVNREHGISLKTIINSGLDLRDPEMLIKTLVKGKPSFKFSPAAVEYLRYIFCTAKSSYFLALIMYYD